MKSDDPPKSAISKAPVNPSANPNDDASISKAKRTELIMRLQDEVEPSIFGQSPGAFDGKNNLYSVTAYSFGASRRFEVPWGPPRGQRKGRTITIALTHVNDIDRRFIAGLLQGVDSSVQQGSEAMMTLNMLNIFVQAQPRMQEGTLYNARSFYVSESSNQRDNIFPFELWRGYYQTVRPTYNRLIINVDVTVGVVVPARPLIDIFMAYTRSRDIRALNNFSKDHPSFRSLKLFAKSLKFTVDLPGHKKLGTKPRGIWDLVPDCGAITFDKHGEEVSVADHFYRSHHVTIPPRSLGIKTKKGDIFPISVCRTTPQLYKGKNAPNIVSEAMKFMPQNPTDRLADIKRAWRYLRYSESAFMLQAGLSVDVNPLRINGRILPRPGVSFGGSEDKHKFPGVWDVMKKKFFKAAKFERWTVVCFAQHVNMGVIGKFVEGLATEMRGHGINANRPHNISQHNPHADVARVLMEEGRAANPELILVILPESAEDLRNAVKRFGDIECGVKTQCVKWTGKREREVVDNRNINQYYNNLILKINMRMGGINFTPSRSWFQNRPTMVLGADVSHPGPGSAQPSVSALVASVDPWYTRYVAATSVQDPRLEMIEDLESMFEKLLSHFIELNKRPPSQLIFYRDGVSEGEFVQVVQVEVPRLAAVLGRKCGPDKSRWPALNFIVVGKKHHVRFFPTEGGGGGDSRGNYNMYPGFIVDGEVVHPVYPDFYLQSQAGLKGTSRPSHYTVLRVTSLSLDELQEFTFHLCHCYLRSTRSVKIPAPVYYADLVCSRAKFHFGDNGSISGESTGSGTFDLDMWKRNFAPIHPNMAASMYWV
jgi:eukaryotic translation initiation factor 2C